MNNSFLLEEKYIIEKTLQQSRMGTTYLAKSQQDNLKCIIKSVSLDTLENQQRIINIEEEAKVLKYLNHPNIPKLIEVFTEQKDGVTNIFLVQQYLKGRNIQEIIDNERAFSEIEAVEIVIKICNILNYIHSFSPSIIHQDIKPANILLESDGNVNLIDFGAVKQKILNHEKAGLSTIIGTQGFMSIEQFEGKALPASDIYSLGLTLISMITRKSPLSLEKKGLYFTFKDIKLSPDLQDIIKRMTAPDYHQRYKNVIDLKEDLEFFIANINKNKSVKLFSTKDNLKVFIKSQIAENERLRWFGISKRTLNVNWKKGIAIFIKYHVVSFFLSISMFLMIFFFSQSFLFKYTFIPSVILSVGLIIWTFIAFLKEINFFKKTAYVITNKRLFLIDSEKYYKRVETYNHQDLKSVIVTATYKHNYGDILVTRNNSDRVLLKKVENFDMIYRILLEIIKENRNEEQF